MKITTALVITLLCCVSPAYAGLLRTVALSDNAAPGTGEKFAHFGDFAYFPREGPKINNAGQVAFRGYLAGPGVGDSNDNGFWSEGSGSLALVARKGDIAPGTSANFTSMTALLLNEAGQTAFSGRLTGSGDAGIWSEGSGSLALVARQGNVAPGTSDHYASFRDLAFNNAGQTAFMGDLVGSNDRGIWSEGNGSLALVAREGDNAPDTSEKFYRLPQNGIAFNSSGETVFKGLLIDSGTGVYSTGLWAEVDGSLTVTARENTPSTQSYSSFYSFIALNDSGKVVFAVYLNGLGAICTEEGGTHSVVAQERDSAPGTNETFGGLHQPVINNSGETAFVGLISGAKAARTGVWSENGGSLNLVARSGDPAPGTNVTFSAFAVSKVNHNSAGQTEFYGAVTGPGVDDTNTFGVWAQDKSGELRLIVRQGDQIDVDDGPGVDLRTVGHLDVASFSDGRSFNDGGQMAFSALFTDGSSGVFVSNVASIPEPNTLLLGVLAAVGVLSRCRLRGNRSDEFALSV